VNILLLTSEFAPANGGIGTYAREIASAATELGADVTVIAPDYAQDTTALDRSLPFEVRRFRGGLHSMRGLPSKVLLTRRRLGAERYDVVHAADWPFFIPVALSQRLTQARILMTVHGTEINETQTPLKRIAIRSAGVFGPRTDIAANSQYTSELFRERFAVDAQRIRAINLGVSNFWFGRRNGRAATRVAYGIARDRIVIVTVARITRRKGHSVTLAALAALPERLRKQITWLVIGPDGEKDYVEQLKKLIAETDCDVRFLGSIEDEKIRDIYGAADFFCLTGVPDPSGRVEGFGLVYLEAGAGGLPSVATAVGGVPDAVLADETGLLVPASTEDIARAIATLAEDTDTRSILAAGASSHARALSWERCAAKTYDLSRSGKSTIDRLSDRSLSAARPRQQASTPYVSPA
jgi:glycosyltransferase involved in cell wall biosynthesis